MPNFPIQGIKGAKVQPKSSSLPVLKSDQYLDERTRNLILKNQEKTLDIAVRRNELVERKLVVRQASYLMVAARQKLLAMPVRCAAKLAAANDRHKCQQILQAEVLAVLEELRRLPEAVEPGWLANVEAEEEHAVSQRKA